jgi:hypothetical protein
MTPFRSARLQKLDPVEVVLVMAKQPIDVITDQAYFSLLNPSATCDRVTGEAWGYYGK